MSRRKRPNYIAMRMEQLIKERDNPNNNDAQGFPALDYMLYGSDESDEKIVDKYLLENKKYNTYLSSLIDKMVSNTSVVVNDWNQNKDTYMNSTENR